MAVWPATAAAQQTPSTGGHVSAVIPKASVFRPVKGRNVGTVANKGDKVFWGDILRTEAAGRARIVLQDQSILTLGSNSTLRIVKHDSESQQTALELGYGRIRCQVSRLTSGKGSFELRTPTAVAGVIGTDFGADSSDPEETRFVCVTGAVRIRSSDPKIEGFTDCQPGMTVVVRRGRVPGQAMPATPEQIERWKHITEPDDREFATTIPVPVEAPGKMQRGPDPFTWLDDTSAGRIRWGKFDVGGSIRFRAEGWDWFDTPLGEDVYGYAHSTLKFEIGQRRERWNWLAEITQPSVFGLPENSIAAPPAGQLGLGATYFNANGGRRNAAAIFPSQFKIQWQGLGGDARNQFTLGRFRFVDGAETTPSDVTVGWLKRVRIAHRLIGDFAWSATGRSNDGAVLSWNAGAANLTFAAARPTAGVFKVNGLGDLDAVWAYGAWTIPLHDDKGELRLFGLGYGDGRAIVKTDNRPSATRSGADVLENIRIGTFGGNYLRAMPTQSSGTFDLLLWGVLQNGDWGLQRHRAGATAVEVGWQPKVNPLRPWLRVGYSYGSGDDDATDDRHSTFFPVLPTPRQYARFPFYNSQNNQDLSAMLILRPVPQINIRSEAHFLTLAAKNDLWYSGGGAYSRGAFGFQGRPSGGSSSLANVWDISADYRPSPRWSFGVYFAHAWGRDVMRNIYPTGTQSNFGYAEAEFRF
ncbi:MAG TPA: FecR domain-containing protein [Terriglobales bacterium]|nr:FecR domain-containing protein [Terriglobales bacterium]